MATLESQNDRIRAEVSVLEKYGLRWAVLAAWADELRSRGATLPGEATRRLEESRIMIASGCFSSCTVGCDLSAIEAALIGAATSMGEASARSADFWLELLAHAMEDPVATARLLNVPAIRFRYAEGGFGPCQCPG